MKKIILCFIFVLLSAAYFYPQNISLKSLSGKYECVNGNIKSEIEINFIEDNKFYIEGFAISDAGGHNCGIIEKSLAYYDRRRNKIVYNEYEYELYISIISMNHLYIIDNAISKSYFGMGISFEGLYNRAD